MSHVEMFSRILYNYNFVIPLGANLVKLLSKKAMLISELPLEWALMLEKVYSSLVDDGLRRVSL